MATEREDAITLANKILDRVNADPDDDLAVLSRQLLRTSEGFDRLHEAMLTIHAYAMPYRDDSFGALDRIAKRADQALNGK
jgi:hypothetical protein